MIELRNLHKSYRVKGEKKVEALKGIDLVFPDKGFIFVLGKSGSGKSTLLNVIGGLDSFDEGDLILFGKSARSFTMKDYNSYRSEYVGFIFQEYNILPHLTVFENVALALQIQGREPQKEEIESILSEVGILDLKDRKPSQLSGGQKQRVAIARALVKKPKVILADEPTGALDSQNTKDIFNLLAKMSRECLVLCVTHDGAFAERYADRIVRLKEGRVIGDYDKVLDSRVAIEGTDKVYRLSKGLLEIERPQELDFQDLQKIQEETKDNPGKGYYAYGEKIRLPIDLIEGDDSESLPYGFIESGKKESSEKDVSSTSYRSGNSHLSFLTLLKMGAENLTHGITRLCFTLVLSILAFTMLGVVASVSSFSAPSAFVTSRDLFAQKSMALEKVFYLEEGSATSFQTMDEEDFLSIQEEFPQALPSYSAYPASLSSNLLDPSFDSTGYLRSTLKSVTILQGSENFPEEYGFEVEGGLPTEKDEVMLTNYHVELFDLAGVKFLDGTSLEKGEVDSSKLIGKRISLTSLDPTLGFTITGILETDVDIDAILEAANDEENVPNSLSRSNIILDYYQNGPALPCYLSQALLEDETFSLFSPTGKRILFALVPSDSNGAMEDIYRFSEEKKVTDEDEKGTENYPYKGYLPVSPAYDALNDATFQNTIASIGQIGFYAAIILTILSVLITMNYMFTSISFKKEEIGVLKGLGARSTDIFGIFAIQALILGVFEFALSSILSFVAIGFLDGFLGRLFTIPLSLIQFNLVTALLLLLVSVLFALVSALIPSYSIASMKPVDAMKRGN